MKGTAFIVACIAAGVWPSPLFAFRMRSPGPQAGHSLEEWFTYLLSNSDCYYALRISLVICAIFGLMVGVVMRQRFETIPPKKEFGRTFLRTPTVAVLLTPIGAATLIFAYYNHTPKMFTVIDWHIRPYFDHWLYFCVVMGMVGAILVAMFNLLELTFEKAEFKFRLVIMCCWPLAVLLCVVYVAGILGSGLWIGARIGQNYGYPSIGGWSGMCFAMFALAMMDDIFWLAYFPMARVRAEK